jgi:hypothetical protein
MRGVGSGAMLTARFSPVTFSVPAEAAMGNGVHWLRPVHMPPVQNMSHCCGANVHSEHVPSFMARWCHTGAPVV